MRIIRKSIISGLTNSMELPITFVQMDAYMSGVLVQKAFPQLSAEQREFIMTGITPEEWAKLYPEEDEEEEGHGNFQGSVVPEILGHK